MPMSNVKTITPTVVKKVIVGVPIGIPAGAGFALTNLDDVTLVPPYTHHDILAWDSNHGMWSNITKDSAFEDINTRVDSQGLAIQTFEGQIASIQNDVDSSYDLFAAITAALRVDVDSTYSIIAGFAAIATSGSATDLITGTLPTARFSDSSHGSRSGGSLHSLADSTHAGFLSAADKLKLINLSGVNTGDQTITLSGVVSGSGTGAIITTMADGTLALTKLASQAANTILGATAIGSPTAIAVSASRLLGRGSSGNLTNLTAGTGMTFGASSFGLATMPANTLKGNGTGATAAPTDLTATSVRTLLNVANGATANDTDANLRARSTHTGTQLASTISNFDSAVAANAAVVANTAKVTNATHTGDVTGDSALTIAADVVTNLKLANMAANTIKGRDSSGSGDPMDLDSAQVRAIINIPRITVSTVAPSSPALNDIWVDVN